MTREDLTEGFSIWLKVRSDYPIGTRWVQEKLQLINSRLKRMMIINFYKKKLIINTTCKFLNK